MNNTITADKCDIGNLATSYADIMRFHITGNSFHIGSHGPRNVLNAYLRLSEKLGVKLMNDYCIESITKQIDDEEKRLKAIVLRTFGARKAAAE